MERRPSAGIRLRHPRSSPCPGQKAPDAEDEHREGDEGLEGGGRAIDPEAQPAKPLEPADGPLDDVALLQKTGVLGVQAGLLLVARDARPRGDKGPVPVLEDEGAVEANEGAVEALALHEEVEERAPQPAVPRPSAPEAEAAPVRDAGGAAGVVEVAPPAARAQHPQDAGQQLPVRVGRPARPSAWWCRETLGDEGELPRGEDVDPVGAGHGMASPRGVRLHPLWKRGQL